MKEYTDLDKLKPLKLSIEMEIEITGYISKIIKEDKLKALNYNICVDHIHLLLYCKNCDRDNIVRKLKGKTTQLYKQSNSILEKYHLWARNTTIGQS